MMSHDKIDAKPSSTINTQVEVQSDVLPNEVENLNLAINPEDKPCDNQIPIATNLMPQNENVTHIDERGPEHRQENLKENFEQDNLENLPTVPILNESLENLNAKLSETELPESNENISKSAKSSNVTHDAKKKADALNKSSSSDSDSFPIIFDKNEESDARKPEPSKSSELPPENAEKVSSKKPSNKGKVPHIDLVSSHNNQSGREILELDDSSSLSEDESHQIYLHPEKDLRKPPKNKQDIVVDPEEGLNESIRNFLLLEQEQFAKITKLLSELQLTKENLAKIGIEWEALGRAIHPGLFGKLVHFLVSTSVTRGLLLFPFLKREGIKLYQEPATFPANVLSLNSFLGEEPEFGFFMVEDEKDPQANKKNKPS